MNGVKMHVRDLDFADRLLCGRLNTGQGMVGLKSAPAYTNLCLKCRQRLQHAWGLLAVIARPKPGLQLEFDFERDRHEQRKATDAWRICVSCRG